MCRYTAHAVAVHEGGGGEICVRRLETQVSCAEPAGNAGLAAL